MIRRSRPRNAISNREPDLEGEIEERTARRAEAHKYREATVQAASYMTKRTHGGSPMAESFRNAHPSDRILHQYCHGDDRHVNAIERHLIDCSACGRKITRRSRACASRTTAAKWPACSMARPVIAVDGGHPHPNADHCDVAGRRKRCEKDPNCCCAAVAWSCPVTNARPAGTAGQGYCARTNHASHASAAPGKRT